MHKTQSLSIKHLVAGCLEGVFALGQVYVLTSRCTDPQNYCLIGVPPKDLLEDIWQAVARAGKDPEAFFRKNVSVTKDLFLVFGLFAAPLASFGVKRENVRSGSTTRSRLCSATGSR
jgi:hypothetical protein